MKISIYELLGLFKDGNAPKKIKYENREYYLYDSKSYLTTDKTRFFDKIYFTDLNIEVEILEEEKKIPEKCNVLEHCVSFSKNENVLLDNQLKLQDKINEIIDYLKSKGE